MGEDTKAYSTVRQDTNNEIKKLEKSKEINEDDSNSLQKRFKSRPIIL